MENRCRKSKCGLSEKGELPKESSGKGAQGITGKVLKVMGLFTGVEMAGVLASIVKMKFMAIWLEASGLGLLNIFNNTIEVGAALTGLGLRQSSVRDISKEGRKGLPALRAFICKVRTWSRVSGLLGAFLLLVLSWPLAELIFGDWRMWWNFALLGGVLLLNAMFAGEAAVFQGTEQFRRLARASLEGTWVGLGLSIPMFRWLGDDSVVLSIVVYSAAMLFFAWLNRDKRFPYERPKIEEIKGNNGFVKFGAWIGVTAFVNYLCQLVFSAWLNNAADLATVGFYGAGMVIVVRYTNMVFQGVSMEYYPRVSANLGNPRRLEIFMNHEISLLLSLFMPIVLAFFLVRTWIVELLYTKEFLVILPFITWAFLTVLLRSVSNTMAYTIMAKGEGKVYLLTEMADASLNLALTVIFYKIWGLEGIGVAMVCGQGCFLMMEWAICRRRYGLRLSTAVKRQISVSYAVVAVVMLLLLFADKILWVSAAALACLIYLRLLLNHFRHRKQRN